MLLFPKIGQNITLIALNLKNEEIEYNTVIYDIFKDGRIQIAIPIKKGRFIYLVKGMNFKMRYGVENRGIFSFDVEVLETADREKGYVTIKKTSEASISQRRKYFRVDTMINVDINVIEENGFEEKTKTINLSGGGLKFYLKGKIKEDQLVNMFIYLPNGTIEVKSRIIKVDKVQDYLKRKVASAEFIEINEEDRNEIVKFVFMKERELLKKGM